MNNSSKEEFEFDVELGSAIHALMKTPVSGALTQRVKQRALSLEVEQSAEWPLNVVSKSSSRRLGFRGYPKLIAGITIVATVIAVMLAIPKESTNLFAQVIENVKKMEAVTFRSNQKAGPNEPRRSGKILILGDRIRFESEDGLPIVRDMGAETILVLDDKRKLAEERQMDNADVQTFSNPIEQLRRLKPNGAADIGEEYINGRLTRIFQIANPSLFRIQDDAGMTVWVDSESALPVKVVVRWPNKERELDFEDFQWNASISDAMFTKPDDYVFAKISTNSSITEPPPASRVTTEELADGFLASDRVPCKLAWSNDGQTLTAILRDSETTPPHNSTPNEVRQWNVSNGAVTWSHNIRGGDDMAVSPDGSKLAIAIPEGESVETRLQIRDTKTGKVQSEWELTTPIGPLSFSPDGTLLVGGVMDWNRESGGVRIWDMTGKERKVFEDDKTTHLVAFSRDGKHVAAASNGGAVKIWSIDDEKLVRVIPSGPRFDFSPDGKHFACMAARPINGDSDEDVRKRYDVQVYEWKTGKLVQTLQSEHSDDSWVTHIEYSSDGHRLVAANWDGKVRIWDVESGKLSETIPKHDGGVLSATFSPSGKRLATGAEDKGLRLWAVK